MAGRRHFVMLLVRLCVVQVLGWKQVYGTGQTKGRIDTVQRASESACPSVCHCTHFQVSCNMKNLHHMPEGLPNDTDTLSLNGNRLTALDGNMFRDLLLLETFSAMYNRISVVENGTFSLLLNLIEINLSKNPLLVSSMENILCSLQSLSYSDIMLDAIFENDEQALSKEQFRCLQYKEVYSLSLRHNNFGDFPDGLFTRFNIGTLNLKNSTSTTRYNTKAFLGIHRITELDLSVNNLRNFPQFRLEGKTMVPNLTSLTLDYNSFSQLTVQDMQGLEDLELLSLNNILSIGLEFFVESGAIASLPSLRWLYYRGNTFDIASQQATMFRSTTLTSLDVSNLKLGLTDGDTVVFDMFKTMPNLRQITTSNLDFSWFLTHDKDSFFATAFQNLLHLVSLDLSRNRLTNLHRDMFNGTANLQILNIRNNLLKQWQFSVFTGLVSLQVLDISDNAIQVLEREFFPQNGQYMLQLSSLKLKGNPFSCICDLLWFVQFIRRHPKKFTDINDCKCAAPSNLKGTSLVDFKISASDCALPIPVAFFILASATFACLLIVLVVSFIYRFRWHVKYTYFQMRSKYSSSEEQVDLENYSYDVFVSYQARSLRWVKTRILPLLEDKLKLKVCLHDRDWLAGRDIVDNIVTSISESRKVILLVTNAFARSQWCQLELTMAQQHLFEKDKNNLILILLEDIHPYNMTPRLALQMKTQTYIEWNEDSKAQELFQRKLVKAVERPSRSFRLQAVYTRSAATVQSVTNA